MKGNILYPLNSLKKIYPEIFVKHFSKYKGREIITKHRIPFLNCLWNDVLHFSAVNPKDIKQALIEAGRDADFTWKCYQVDPEILSPENSIVYLYEHADAGGKLAENNFTPFDPNDTVKYSQMPLAAKDYYKEMISMGKPVLLFHRIPHILYKGNLDISDLKIITL